MCFFNFPFQTNKVTLELTPLLCYCENSILNKLFETNDPNCWGHITHMYILASSYILENLEHIYRKTQTAVKCNVDFVLTIILIMHSFLAHAFRQTIFDLANNSCKFQTDQNFFERFDIRSVPDMNLTLLKMTLKWAAALTCRRTATFCYGCVIRVSVIYIHLKAFLKDFLEQISWGIFWNRFLGGFFAKP